MRSIVGWFRSALQTLRIFRRLRPLTRFWTLKHDSYFDRAYRNIGGNAYWAVPWPSPELEISIKDQLSENGYNCPGELERDMRFLWQGVDPASPQDISHLPSVLRQALINPQRKQGPSCAKKCW